MLQFGFLLTVEKYPLFALTHLLNLRCSCAHGYHHRIEYCLFVLHCYYIISVHCSLYKL